VVMSIGVAARKGDNYQMPTGPFDPGEPLADIPDAHDAGSVVATARARGLRVQIIGANNGTLSEAPAGAIIQTAAMTSSESMVIRLT
jgi:hypothetical protein